MAGIHFLCVRDIKLKRPVSGDEIIQAVQGTKLPYDKNTHFIRRLVRFHNATAFFAVGWASAYPNCAFAIGTGEDHKVEIIPEETYQEFSILNYSWGLSKPGSENFDPHDIIETISEYEGMLAKVLPVADACQDETATISIKIECTPCGATGAFRYDTDPPGRRHVCTACNGEGYQVITYTPFTVRRTRDDIDVVFPERPRFGKHQPTEGISYDFFKKGNYPR